jgi:hypothetical protein
MPNAADGFRGNRRAMSDAADGFRGNRRVMSEVAGILEVTG